MRFFDSIPARTVALILALGLPQFSSAHTLEGQSLGATPTATDRFNVTCFSDGQGPVPHHLAVQISDEAPVAEPVLIVTVSKSGRQVEGRSAPADDGNGRYSPTVSLAGGGGLYQLSVTKSGPAAEHYSLVFHCESAANVHVGTMISARQNQ